MYSSINASLSSYSLNAVRFLFILTCASKESAWPPAVRNFSMSLSFLVVVVTLSCFFLSVLFSLYATLIFYFNEILAFFSYSWFLAEGITFDNAELPWSSLINISLRSPLFRRSYLARSFSILLNKLTSYSNLFGSCD